MANFLINQELLHVSTLIPTQLNNLFIFLIFLNGTIAREVFLKCFAYTFDIKIISKTSYSCDTFSSISLLYSNVNLLSLGSPFFVSSILESICSMKWDKLQVMNVLEKRPLCVRESDKSSLRSTFCKNGSNKIQVAMFIKRAHRSELQYHLTSSIQIH